MSHRILIVDDEPGVREALRQLLEYEGYAVSLAASGHEALDRYAEVRPHLELALAKMSTEQREVFLLHELHGMSFQEIGEITEVSLNTAKSRYRYAIASLRRSLAPLNDDVSGVGAAHG